MRKLLLTITIVLMVGCDALPTGSSDVERIDSEFFSIRNAKGANFVLTHNYATEADKRLREVAACVGIDLSVVIDRNVKIRLWGMHQTLPGGGGGHFDENTMTLDLYEDYNMYDQGWRHEMIHMLLYIIGDEDYADCPATKEQGRLNSKPWVCQFSWAS